MILGKTHKTGRLKNIYELKNDLIKELNIDEEEAERLVVSDAYTSMMENQLK